MNKRLESVWFKPYTPIIIVVLIIVGIAKGVYPTVQKAITAQKVEVPLPQAPVTPTPFPDEKSLLEAIDKLIRLPEGEHPDIIPIRQIEQFKNQPFFKDAKNGDILLVYNKNKKAILYDPVENRIIDTAPITPGTESPLPNVAGTSTQAPTKTPATPPTSPISPTTSPTPQPTLTPTPTPTPQPSVTPQPSPTPTEPPT